MNIFELFGRIAVDNRDAISQISKTSKAAAEIGKSFGKAQAVTGKSLAQIASENGKTVNQIRSEVAKAAAEYRKQGMSASEAMKKAYADIGYSAEKAHEEINEEVNQTGSKYGDLASKAGKAFTNIGKFAVNCGKVMAKGLAVGGAAMTGLVVKGMGLAGELEQNMGGAEAVFQEFAETMKKTAAEAYRTMGLSQSDYLATANKMGSLFKGAGFEAGEAADMTAEAMRRAADVASIMGLDIGAAMESIAGAAKGNFTMMDNLGVAINDTTLKNYALEKGIKKSTAQMTTQEKVGLAMQLFLEKTADYAGNYAKENDTLAGSLTTAKAAFQDFLSGAGDADALTEALLNAGDVIIRKADKLVPKLVEGTNKLIKKLSPRLPGLIQSALPGIIDGAVSLMTGLVQAIPGIWSRIVWPGVRDVMKFTLGIELPRWPKRVEIQAWWDESGIGPLLEDKFGNIKSFFEDIMAVLGNITDWATGEGSGFVEKVALIAAGIAMLVNPTLALAAASVWLITNWNSVKESVGSAFDTTVSWLEDNLGTPMENFRTNVIQPLLDRWGEVKQNIKNAAIEIGDFLGIDLIAGWDTVTNAISSAWQTVTGWIQAATEALGNFFSVDTGDTSNAPWYVQQHPELYNPGTDWNADGAVFRKPTIFNTRLGLQGVGEAGPEAVAPIGVLQGYVQKAVRSETSIMAEEMRNMVQTFTETVENLRSQPVAINVDSKAVAVLMAREMTKSIGNRNIQSLMAMGG